MVYRITGRLSLINAGVFVEHFRPTVNGLNTQSQNTENKEKQCYATLLFDDL